LLARQAGRLFSWAQSDEHVAAQQARKVPLLAGDDEMHGTAMDGEE
jgi:hypothetical protein